MDDLYGDDKSLVASGGWAIPKAKASNAKEITANYASSNFNMMPRQVSTVSGNNKTSASELTNCTTIKSQTKAASLNFAFKPRQAVSLSSSSLTTRTSLNTQQKVVSAATPPSGAEKVEFNLNSSFDVQGAYDPAQPHDYIAYCEERLNMRKQMKLEESNKRKMEELAQVRLEYEKERQRAIDSGDYQKMIAVAAGGVLSSMMENSNSNSGSSTCGVDFGVESSNIGDSNQINISAARPAGRGRGRGVMNLPAWVTQQMANAEKLVNEESSAPAHNSGGVASAVAAVSSSSNVSFSSSSSGAAAGFESTTAAAGGGGGVKRKIAGVSGLSKPSRVILLKNMVRYKDVDESLAEETKTECMRFGPVLECKVYNVVAELQKLNDVNNSSINNESHKMLLQTCPDEECVRMFVSFERQDSAIKACRDLNGRFFAGRKVVASYYDEEKFKRKDLAPTDCEW